MSSPPLRSRRGRPPGRRPGAPDTRGEILAAAREQFAAHGYDGATIRGIATAAGVDPALVHHYFGTKERVFVAAMELPFVPADVTGALVAGDQDGMGERLARLFVSVWGNPMTRAPFLALIRSALGHEMAATMLRQFVRGALLSPLASALAAPDRELRIELCASQLIGLGLARYVIRIEPLASAEDEEVIALVAPTLQRYLTGPLPGP